MKINAKLCISLRACCFSLLLIILNLSSSAQVTSTSIRGLVRDAMGAVIPNANIKLTDNATGVENTTVSSSNGNFIFTGLQSGTYKLTVTVTGFQTSTNPSIVVYSGRTTDISMELVVSGASETVQISSGSDQLKITSNEIGTTIDNRVVMNLPYANRDGLSFALLMAGNASANDSTGRQSTFNGLPNASMNITLDGMNNNSQRFKSGGTSFFSFAPARIDALEEVTVLTAGLGSDAGGQGAMNIRLTTKRGTDQYHGKVLHQFANEAMNANTYYNNLQGRPRTKTRLNHAVGSIGGPLLPFIPKLKDKLFFFAYYEAVPQPTTFNATATVLASAAQQGNFTYVGTDQVTRTVNLLAVAGGRVDPTVKSILNSINETGSNASLLPVGGTPILQTMVWSQSRDFMTAYPTARIDYQINPNIAWHGTWNLRKQTNPGYPLYPGSSYNFPNAYKITTYVATNTLDWTIKPNMINSITFGVQSNGEYFYQGANPTQYSAQGTRILNFPTISNLTLSNIIPGTGFQPFIRNNPVYQITENLNWVKGRHTITLGGALLHTSFHSRSYGSAGVPEYWFGVNSDDPAATLLSNALPRINIAAGDYANALNLYAMLTGRVNYIRVQTNADENTKQYVPFSPITQRFAFTTLGTYAQDSFRLRPDLTINFGLRWQFDGAIHSTNGINYMTTTDNFYGPSKGLLQPGILSGNNNPAFTTMSTPYKRDFINPAPNFGFAWNPSAKDGLTGKILGDRKTVIRGSYSISFFNEGLNTISNPMGNGPGSRQSGAAFSGVHWTPGTMNLNTTVPSISSFPATFGDPIAQSSYAFAGQPGYLINPNLRSPYTQSWTLGIQRELEKNTVVEFRYVGNKSTHLWHEMNVQEVNIFENNFLGEFNQARNNLTINLANGRGNTFRNNSLPGQAAIPIFETAFGANGSNPVLGTNVGFGSATFINNLNQGSAGTLANTLATNSTYYCRLVGSNFAPCANLGFSKSSSYPINFFYTNPYLGNMWYQDSNGNSNYNALQIDLNRRYSQGLSMGANYTWSHALGDQHNFDNQEALYQWFTTRNSRLNYMSTPFDRRHVFNLFYVYELPFGKGKTFSTGNGIIDRVIGGWSIGGRNTIASGNPFLLDGGRLTVNNLSQSGVIFGGDLTPEKLQKALSKVSGYYAANKVMISDITDIADVTTTTSRVKSNLYASASTPGEYGWFAQLRNNNYYQLDLNLTKEIRFTERWKLSLRADAFNFLNHPFFAIGNTNPNSSAFGQVTSATGSRTMQIRAALEW